MFTFNKKKLILVSLGVCLVLFLASVISVFKPPVISTCKYPCVFFLWIKREIGAIIFYHRNFTANETLKKENALLRKKIIDLNELFLENERLRSLLSFKQQSPSKMLCARVIGYSPDSWSSSIIIDKGRSSGIRRGHIAVTHRGLVGRVVEVTDAASKILLVSDPALSVSAIVQRSRQEGLVCGTLGNTLIMKYLPKEADIKVNDTILTSGLTDTYPKGLLIGSVIDIQDEFSGLSRYAIIKPAVNVSNLEEVLVIFPR